MTSPERNTTPDSDAAWQRLARAARTASPAAAEAAPEGFADRVLALARSRGPGVRAEVEVRRVLSWGAALALAASLLVAVTSWSDLSSTFGGGALFEDLISWELLP